MPDDNAVVHTERVFVTAEMARRWLLKNIENNRPINENRVRTYGRDMKANRWEENGDTIKFAIDGSLIDGQHRLRACVETGIGFWTQVAYGISPEAFLTIDRNQVRSTGQMLHLSVGVSDYNAIATTITLLACFREGIMIRDYRPTTPEAAELLAANPGLPDSVTAARRMIHQFKAGPVPALALCHYLFTRQDATLAEIFFEALCTGASLREVDPVFQLRARIIAAKSSPARRIATYELLALFFKTWLAEREQRTVGVLRWVSGESFPNIGQVTSIAKIRPEKIVAVPVKKPRGRPPRNVATLDSPVSRLSAKLAGLDRRSDS